MSKTLILDESNSYYSKSLGRRVLFTDMCDEHLARAIAKLLNAWANGADYNESVLQRLQGEQKRRQTPSIEKLTVDTEDINSAVEEALRKVEVVSGPRARPGDFLNQLAQTVTNLLSQFVGATPSAAPVEVLSNTGGQTAAVAPEQLQEVLREHVPLLNYLAAVGVAGLDDIPHRLSCLDFLSLRWSNAAAFRLVNTALRRAGLNWAPTSHVLRYDGEFLPRIAGRPREGIHVFIRRMERQLGAGQGPVVAVADAVRRRVTGAVWDVSHLLLRDRAALDRYLAHRQLPPVVGNRSESFLKTLDYRLERESRNLDALPRPVEVEGGS